jgi:KEOPS complex subunit Cgi121
MYFFTRTMRNVTVLGIKCERPFNDIVKHFIDLGGDVILMDPEFVCGRDHIVSAVMHAERAFEHGTNRSKTLLTETLLYAAGERQISKALAKMRPKDGNYEMAAAVFDVPDMKLDTIGAVRDDKIIKCTNAKLKKLGISVTEGVPPEDLVLEMVAVVDIQKQ